MTIIKIQGDIDGSHEYQIYSRPVKPMEGWAIIPEGMEVPESFPFVGVDAEGGVVTRLTPGTAPKPEPEPEETVSTEDILKSILGG